MKVEIVGKEYFITSKDIGFFDKLPPTVVSLTSESTKVEALRASLDLYEKVMRFGTVNLDSIYSLICDTYNIKGDKKK